jgi:hypothetical protein
MDHRKNFLYVIVAVGVGVVAAFFCYQVRLYFFPGSAGDYSWALYMARDLLAGRDPYNFTPSALLVPYPLPVVIFGLPFVWLPNELAAACFFGISSGVLTYSILRFDHPWRLLSFLSLPYIYALLFTQWSPLIMASWFVPVLAPTLALIKPQTALPVALNKITRKGVIFASILLLVSLIIYPTWPLRWLAMIRGYDYVIPILTPPVGPFLFLSLFFWRRPEARLLFLTSLLPYRGAYDLLPLWIIPQSLPQMIVLVGTPWIISAIWPTVGFTLISSPAVVPLLCLPALIILLWDSYGKNQISVLLNRWQKTS